MHANKELITDVLKGELGFDGLVISDWRAIRQIPGDYREQVRLSTLAGIDMFMEPIQAPNNPDGWDVFIPTLTSLVEDGEVPMSRIDDAVSRILTAKFDLGLFEHPFTDRRNIDKIGSKAHRKVARRAVAESQVLLKNRQGTLPLSPGKKQPVYVAGSNADNIGNQAGGWTLTWQGGSTNVIPGQTVLDAVRATSRSRVQFSETASDPVPGQCGRRRGGRRDAVRRGVRRRQRPASGPTTPGTTASRGPRRPCCSATPTSWRSAGSARGPSRARSWSSPGGR